MSWTHSNVFYAKAFNNSIWFINLKFRFIMCFNNSFLFSRQVIQKVQREKRWSWSWNCAIWVFIRDLYFPDKLFEIIDMFYNQQDSHFLIGINANPMTQAQFLRKRKKIGINFGGLKKKNLLACPNFFLILKLLDLNKLYKKYN